jgi:hypothetical protein
VRTNSALPEFLQVTALRAPEAIVIIMMMIDITHLLPITDMPLLALNNNEVVIMMNTNSDKQMVVPPTLPQVTFTLCPDTLLRSVPTSSLDIICSFPFLTWFALFYLG